MKTVTELPTNKLDAYQPREHVNWFSGTINRLDHSQKFRTSKGNQINIIVFDTIEIRRTRRRVRKGDTIST